MHDLLSIMKVQNELILNANKKTERRDFRIQRTALCIPVKKTKFKIVNLLRVGDLALLVLPEGWLCVSGKNQMC